MSDKTPDRLDLRIAHFFELSAVGRSIWIGGGLGAMAIIALVVIFG